MLVIDLEGQGFVGLLDFLADVTSWVMTLSLFLMYVLPYPKLEGGGVCNDRGSFEGAHRG